MKRFSWHDLPKPFFVFAPMDGVTDTVFRRLIGSVGAPDVSMTEFTNVIGLFSEGAERVSQKLLFDSSEHPLIAQVWGTDPELFYQSALLINKMGFDGIDINMGCPDRAIVKRGSCAALINNPSLAGEIIAATKKGAGRLPVSVKTRLGFNKLTIDTWFPFLLKQGLSALSIHFRTAKEMSKVPAQWEYAKDIVAMRNDIAPNTIIVGNGDVESISEGELKVRETGVDGIMIGRGVFHNPYVFNRDIDYQKITREEKIMLLLKHLKLFEETWHGKKPYAPLKRFFKIYIKDFDDAGELREKLMMTKSVDEARDMLV